MQATEVCTEWAQTPIQQTTFTFCMERDEMIEMKLTCFAQVWVIWCWVLIQDQFSTGGRSGLVSSQFGSSTGTTEQCATEDESSKKKKKKKDFSRKRNVILWMSTSFLCCQTELWLAALLDYTVCLNGWNTLLCLHSFSSVPFSWTQHLSNTLTEPLQIVLSHLPGFKVTQMRFFRPKVKSVVPFIGFLVAGMEPETSLSSRGRQATWW